MTNDLNKGWDISGHLHLYCLIFISCLVAVALITAFYVLLRFSPPRPIRKIFVLNRLLEQEIDDRTCELLESKKSLEDAHTELLQLFNSAASGMRVLDINGRTLRVNKTFEDLTGLEEEKIIQMPCSETFPCSSCNTEKCILQRILAGEERIETKIERTRADGKKLLCILTAIPYRSPEGKLLGVIEDFKDVTDIEQLLNRQQINLGLAQRVLGLINSGLPRYIEVDENTILFSATLFSLCHIAGGDHFFLRQFAPDDRYPRGRTALSLKDQSGHEVNCILKSIATDFMHSIVLHSCDRIDLNYEADVLNRELCDSSLFREDDFVTAVLAEIDHAELALNYISCGHPPFLLIRNQEVLSYPDKTNLRNCPLAVNSSIRFTSERIQLQHGDKLIFYTDGLTEMSFRNTGKVLSTEELKQLVHSFMENSGPLHVSELMNKLFEEIVRRSGEEVIPFKKNSSRDDVTILGVEIEDQLFDGEKKIYVTDVRSLCQHVEYLLNELTQQAQKNCFEFDSYQVRLVLDESLTNAWKHAHGCDSAKPIRVRWRFRNDLQLEIIDQGPGFDFMKVTDPRRKDNRLQESGRGLFLIRLFASHVCWKDHGRQIHIALKRPIPTDRRNTLRVPKVSPLDIWKVHKK